MWRMGMAEQSGLQAREQQVPVSSKSSLTQLKRAFGRERVVKEKEAAVTGKQDWKAIYFKTLLVSHMLSQTSTNKNQDIHTQVVCPARRH